MNKRKIRAKDSVNTVWWFSKTEWPKANVSKVLVPYSDRMKKLLENPDKFYTPKLRPSGHDISKGFGKDNGGAIPSNLLQIPNTESNGAYVKGCKLVGVKAHPARFPAKLPEFFIKYLTEPNDLVIDIFAGSNTCGQATKILQRRWISYDLDQQYVAASAFRFLDNPTPEQTQSVFDTIMGGEQIKIENRQKPLSSIGRIKTISNQIRVITESSV